METDRYYNSECKNLFRSDSAVLNKCFPDGSSTYAMNTVMKVSENRYNASTRLFSDFSCKNPIRQIYSYLYPSSCTSTGNEHLLKAINVPTLRKSFGGPGVIRLGYKKVDECKETKFMVTISYPLMFVLIIIS